jgi:hypothetical protein
MASETQSMTGRGRKKKITDEQILQLLRSGDVPAWSARKLAENTEVTRQTAHNRLDQLAEKHEAVETMKIGNATVYYYDGALSDPSAPIEERHKESLISEFTDKFVGLPTAPWTAVHPNDGPAEAGDKVQIRVEGVPGRWGSLMTHTWDSRREELIYEETSADESQALISGELYAKPTVPIEHENYPGDYDLELNIGGEYQDVEGRERPILIAAGVKNYLIKPCNDAVFLENVSVDWMSPKGHGQELETVEITPGMIEEVEEAREEAAEAREEYKQADSSEDVEAENPGLEFVEQMLDAAEPAEGWLKNIISLGAISLDEETVDLLVNHKNSPVDSEEELQALVEEVAEEHGGEDAL